MSRSEAKFKIPFNKPSLLGRELQFIEEAVRSGNISGEGTFVAKAEQRLRDMLGGNASVLLTPSCTAALEMSALLLNLQPGDEVVLPSFTFASTATAFVLRGIRPVFADVDPEYLNITPEQIARLITPKTKALSVVHYGGYACAMKDILDIANKSNIPVIEDAAHALGARCPGGYLGTQGCFGAFSFHETKNITCGEGGALVVNDARYLERATCIRDKGTNRRAFQRGDAAFYSWVDIGSSYVMSDILAAFLLAQLERLDLVLERRRKLWKLYATLLRPLKDQGFLTYPEISDMSAFGAHLFFILLPNEQIRERVRLRLLESGIYAVFHYQPLHRSRYVQNQWGTQESLPVTENVASRLLRLPMFYDLSDVEVEIVVDCLATAVKVS